MQNQEYCYYYKGEDRCPFEPDANDYDNDAGFAWMSEKICSDACNASVERFLTQIISHMGKWDPYGCEERFGRYLLANTKIPLESRIKYLETRVDPDHPILKALKEQAKK